MRVAVLQFPGSNADWDALHAVRDVLGADAWYAFHKGTSLGDADAVVIPGGFSYGDYLRAGAIAGFSPIDHSVREFAGRGGPVLGICNGFQILTEMGLLPGALTRNAHLRFECRDIHLRVENEGPFTDMGRGKVLRLPIAHADGRYHTTEDGLADLERHGQIAFRYCTRGGGEPEGSDANPNGSVGDIAGLYNREKNVLGMMPHPERASETILGNDDGFALFTSLRRHLGFE
ncbi:MAG: phosphoribosylformylglycinamidine synthase subunit PurQ [Deltaproteobacteria bacterium]|nr:phosphoribosylformylglycinamidine synthase subunit PurQ [Deltaproteobacteria bacterium]NND28678.1 phosphoribosylformylglycinamidine synthase subunit PurQ [Myxococcales bacterium]MBT8466484.1 phosphoribosylformylglycinamidine synthase subunit PurQ [Deltaproteobacteria bacterium]MBT8481858.1 phosphoribosylformylglycinamidine synthase subunit PurQ [Deltaproteobacteria bacterium]NNK09542.1 phosphoribosylformylglycinamidine synthase subunit PurQ [Myxococcales bacterium]